MKGPARGALRQCEVRELALRRALRVVDVREQHEAVRESPQDQRIDEGKDETDDPDRDRDAREERDRALRDLVLAGAVDAETAAEDEEDRRDAQRARGELDGEVAARLRLRC